MMEAAARTAMPRSSWAFLCWSRWPHPTFISIVLAGTAGYLISPMMTVSVTLGRLQLRAFAGVIIGGMGNSKRGDRRALVGSWRQSAPSGSWNTRMPLCS